MEKNKSTAKKGTHGGARPGAGRPKGAREHISIKQLLETLESKAGGRDYEELLVEDFLEARMNNDTQTTLKYHHLILNKVMSNMSKIEITDSKDAIEAKQAAFAEALAKLVGVNPDAK